MIPVHFSHERSPAERGLVLGATLRPDIERTYASYAALFTAHGVSHTQTREWGEHALAETRAWAPKLAREINGIAVGAGLDPWQLGALNARTEILAATGEGECATSAGAGATGPRTIQSWEWYDTLRHVMLLCAIALRPGFAVCTFTEFGIVGKIGVNSAGLGVHFSVLRHDSDHADIGVPVHVVARRILDEAYTVDEATEIARSARLSASSVFTVVTGDEIRGLELSPAGVAELPPPRRAGSDTRCETLATISLDVAEGRIDVHEGGPGQVTPETWQSLSAKEIAWPTSATTPTG
jgi:isopenicillin-N N-acyltransferase like protein